VSQNKWLSPGRQLQAPNDAVQRGNLLKAGFHKTVRHIQHVSHELLYTSNPRSRCSMTLFRLVLACVSGGILSSCAYAQAAIEYAARTAGTSITNGSGELRLGSCPVDSSVLPCVQHYYPTAFYVAVVSVCLVVAYGLYPKSRV
jgi:hypothetical protein